MASVAGRAVAIERDARSEPGGPPLAPHAVLEALGLPAVLLDAHGRVVEVNTMLCEFSGVERARIVGRPAPGVWWTVADWTDEALLERDELPAGIVGPDGQAVPVLCNVSLVPVESAEPLRLVTFTRTAELRQQGAVTRLAVEQAALARVAQEVARGADASTVFGLVAREVATVLGADAGLVLRFAADSSEVMGAFGAHRSQVGVVFPLEGGGAAVQVARTGRPARVEYPALDPADPTAARVRSQGYRRGVAAPVTVDGRRWGAVLAASTSDRPLPADAEARLERFADMVSLAIAQAQLLEDLARRASTDALTGLLNQGEFHRRLEDECARAARYRRPLSLALLDLDHFKAINDSRGHLVGDRVLQAVAGAIAPVVRPQDLLGRVGGEEFGLVLPETEADAAMAAAERVRVVVEELRVEGIPPVTLSAGVAELAAGATPATLYAAADRVLYDAKRTGRNRVRRADAAAAAP
jgi:diguanylate cyclase (GGDEF)-like protein